MKQIFPIILIVLSSVSSFGQSLQDTVALKAFMDGVILTHLRDKHIAGATVSVIQNGKVLLAKGYGFSDEKNQRLVSPDGTLFRIGSISKMFTWISVMQLVSQGKLKLDEDINVYLKDFKIPTTYPEPVTLKNLMTHTPGFEDLVLGLFGKDSTSLHPLGEILSKQIPARVRPAGSFASYSNHGTGMAAYIVEQVSGLTFNDYVEKNILTPLGMSLTTFRQPLPVSLKPLASKGYKFAGGEFVEQPFEFVPLYPVGAAASSATDMAKFMQAILAHGKLGSAQILDSATLAFMEGPAHQHHPSVNPMRYGFMDLSRNGTTVIGHGGDTFWFHSLMALFPETNAGFFVSFNTDKGGGTYMAVLDEFMERYYPEKNPLPASFVVNAKFLQRFAGAYRPNRYAFHDITTVGSIFGDAKITVVDSTKLKLTTGETVRILIPVDSLTFREEHSTRVYAFRKNDKGEITHMFHGTTPIFAFDRVKGFTNTGIQSTIFTIVCITTVITLLYWPFTYWVRRGYQSYRSSQTLPIGSRTVAWFNYLLLLIFYLGVLTMLSDVNELVYKVPSSFKTLLILPMACIALTLWMLAWLIRIIANRYHTLTSRFYYFILCAVSIMALWQLYIWNFIGFNY